MIRKEEHQLSSVRNLCSSRNGETDTLRILQQALVDRGGGFNWVCTGQMWFSAGNCWEQRGMGVGTSKLDEKIKNAGHMCIQPTRRIVWPSPC